MGLVWVYLDRASCSLDWPQTHCAAKDQPSSSDPSASTSQEPLYLKLLDQFVCACIHTCACVCRPENNPGCPHVLFLRLGLTGLDLTQQARLAGPGSSGLYVRITGPCHTPALLHLFWAWIEALTLPAQPSPQSDHFLNSAIKVKTQSSISQVHCVLTWAVLISLRREDAFLFKTSLPAGPSGLSF